MAKEHIFVISSTTSDANEVIEAHTSKASADAAVRELEDGHDGDLKITKVELKKASPTEPKPSGSNKSKGRSKAKAKNEEEMEEDGDDDDDDDDAADEPKPNRKEVPTGKPNALQGLKLLFTGTFNTMDRKTSEATAKRYGAEVTSMSKIQECDFVVLGTRAGQKKVDEIDKHGLETMDETTFLDMIENGVPEKYHRTTGKGRAEPAKKKQKN